jgi:hypothetical protein
LEKISFKRLAEGSAGAAGEGELSEGGRGELSSTGGSVSMERELVSKVSSEKLHK